jgi:hypothetical protein
VSISLALKEPPPRKTIEAHKKFPNISIISLSETSVRIDHASTLRRNLAKVEGLREMVQLTVSITTPKKATGCETSSLSVSNGRLVCLQTSLKDLISLRSAVLQVLTKWLSEYQK